MSDKRQQLEEQRDRLYRELQELERQRNRLFWKYQQTEAALKEQRDDRDQGPALAAERADQQAAPVRG